MTKIYIKLLDEGSTAYRPTQGVEMGKQVFLVLPTADYDPEDETWEFLPGAIVFCRTEVKGGEEILIARSLANENSASA